MSEINVTKLAVDNMKARVKEIELILLKDSPNRMVGQSTIDNMDYNEYRKELRNLRNALSAVQDYHDLITITVSEGETDFEKLRGLHTPVYFTED